MARTKKAVNAGRKRPSSVADLQARARAIETDSRAVKTISIRLPLGVYEALVEQMEAHRARQHDVLVRSVALGLEALRAGEPMGGLEDRQYRPWTGFDRPQAPEERMVGRSRMTQPDAIANALENATPEHPLFALPGINGNRGLRRPMLPPPAESPDEAVVE